MKSFAAFSLFVSVALAQSSSLIPSGILSACSDFLTKLDSDDSLTTCTGALISATSAFGPGASSNASSAAVSSALGSLCASTSTCSETTIRTTLASFYAACTPELTSSINEKVVQIYDVLYTLTPLKEATCSKNDAGDYCATQIQGSAPAASSLYTSSSSSSQAVLTPNFDALKSSNAAFLFLTPDLAAEQLCTPCTRSVMTAYVGFESDIAYAPGLAQSVLLAGQTALYKQISSACGANFMNNAVQAAGSLSDSIISTNAAAPRAAAAGAGGVAALLGVLTLAVAAAL